MINNGGEQRNLLALFIIYSILFRSSQTARSLNFRSILSLSSFFLSRVNEGEKSDMREKGRERERENSSTFFLVAFLVLLPSHQSAYKVRRVAFQASRFAILL